MTDISSRHSSEHFVLSYLGLRKAIGYIGVGIPFVLAIGKLILDGPGLEDTISAYYHTVMRDVFVGSQCAIAAFMISYRGVDWRDNLAGDLAGVSAIGVALFPVMPSISEPTRYQQVSDLLHTGFAAVFFFTLAYFCLVLFRKTNANEAPTVEKLKRNKIYLLCGLTIIVCIGLISTLHFFVSKELLEQYNPIFWLECLAIISFGLSWLVKGEAIFKDHC